MSEISRQEMGWGMPTQYRFEIQVRNADGSLGRLVIWQRIGRSRVSGRDFAHYDARIVRPQDYV